MLGPVLEIARIETVLPTAPPTLCRMKRKIRRLDQLLRIQTVIRRDGDTNRRADDRAGAIDRIGLRNHLDQALAKLTQNTAIIDIGEHDLEFIVPQTPDFAFIADDAAK